MTCEDIALTMTPGVGVRGVVRLLEVFGDARRIFAATEAELVAEAELRPDLARSIATQSGFAQAHRELQYCERHGIRAIASTDAEYPPLLREIADYPHVIYVKGNVEALSERCIAMVGTRRFTSYGIRMSQELVRGLAERIPDLCVVSGLALGLDAECHRAALAAGARTVAVLPNALPEVVPAQHAHLAHDILESGGALVTELTSQTKQRGTFYIDRNRIIAGLSAGTVVVESPYEGGSLETAKFALGYGRTVCAVPGRVGDKASVGTNNLIKRQMAQLVTSAQDIIEELKWELSLPDACVHPERSVVRLTDDETRIMACFPDTDPVALETIAMQSGLGTGDLSTLLLTLEMAGVVRLLPGNRYLKLR